MSKWCFSKRLKAASGATLTVLLIMGAWHSLGFWEVMFGPKWNSFSIAYAAQEQKNDAVERELIQLNAGLRGAYVLALQSGLNAERKALFEYSREARNDPDNEELAELIFKAKQNIKVLEKNIDLQQRTSAK